MGVVHSRRRHADMDMGLQPTGWMWDRWEKQIAC